MRDGDPTQRGSSPAASAPGKQLLSGEYAVLHGAPAVVAAVDRRARAWLEPAGRGPSALIDAAREAVAEALGEAGAGSLPPVRVETPGFSRRRRKLGLGSSAAAVTAACGALFAARGLGADAHRGRIFDTAMKAHLRSQGGRGSGADVAASVYGGVLVYRVGHPPRPVTAGVPPMVFVWTGTAAFTTNLVAAVEEAARRDPAAHRERIGELRDLAEDLAEAWLAGDARAIPELTGAYGEAMARLGRLARAPIVPPVIERIARLARGHRGAAKPSGAGGGDTALAVFADAEQAAAFAADCRTVGLATLDLCVGEPGLRNAADERNGGGF